jgi:adenylate cyclase
LHLWADRYDRDLDDIFALQDEITKAIVDQLKVKLLPEEKKAIATAPTNNVEAYDLVLMARHYDYSGSVADTKAALRFAERAAAMDPNFAEAWALVAISRSILHELIGLEDNGLAAAERALTLNPSLATAHAAKGRALAGLGRSDEAMAFHAESLRLNPDSFDAHYLYGRTCTQLGRAELAVRHLEKAAALLESDYHALALTPQSYRQLGRHEEALDAGRRALARIEKAVARRPDDTTALIMGAIHLTALGELERATRWANRALMLDPDDPNGLYNLACAFALMCDRDRAIDFLERSLGLMSPQFITWAKNDSDLDNLRDHPRYQALVARAEERLAAQQAEPAAKAG